MNGVITLRTNMGAARLRAPAFFQPGSFYVAANNEEGRHFNVKFESLFVFDAISSIFSTFDIYFFPLELQTCHLNP
jgi:hypothetical protein